MSEHVYSKFAEGKCIIPGLEGLCCWLAQSEAGQQSAQAYTIAAGAPGWLAGLTVHSRGPAES